MTASMTPSTASSPDPQRSVGASEIASEANRPVVLVVEPSPHARGQLRAAVASLDLRVVAVASAAEAWSASGAGRPRVVLVSLGLRDPAGVAAVEVFRQRTGASVVAVTNAPSIDLAVEAVRHGAVDVLATTDEPPRIRRVVAAAMDKARAAEVEQRTRDEAREQYGMSQLLTQSARMLKVFDQIRMVAKTGATALILGETGTGKELVSRAIHDRSHRKDRPFVSVNCGAFTESLLESELFGHEKGSFTGAVGRREGLFEMADGGSLFLDELGETSLNVQVNLLRVLEEMTFRRVGGRDTIRVDVRIIAATNVELEKAVEEGQFRQDLFWRLSVFPIMLPPLRERREDIPLLMRHFLDETAQAYDLEPPSVAPDAMRAILDYSWPGQRAAAAGDVRAVGDRALGAGG